MISRPLLIAMALLMIAILVLGVYVLQARHRAEEVSRRAADLRPLAPPTASSQEKITLTIAYDEDGVLRSREVSAALPPDTEPTNRAREVLRTLITQYVQQPSPHPLAEGADVRDIYIVDRDLAVVDLNAAFANGHRSGILVEEMTIASLIDSLATNMPRIKRVKILIDGKERETLAGHADLSTIYDVQAVHQLVRDMQ